MTGLTVDTLRAWERRYDVVAPGRTRRGRQYTDADVSRLRRLSELVARGYPIGTIAATSNAHLDRLLAGPAAAARPSAARGTAGASRVEDDVLRALDRYDLEQIEAVLNRRAAVLPPRELVFAVVVPLLQEVGRQWEAGRLRPSQEHLVSAIVRSVLGGLLRAVSRPASSPAIVFATPSGERHELGLLCAALLSASAGSAVVYLGPDVPAEDIAHAAVTTGARAVVLSTTTPGALQKAEARKLRALPAGVDLWVGGPTAESLASIAGARARRLDRLDDVVPELARYVR